MKITLSLILLLSFLNVNAEEKKDIKEILDEKIDRFCNSHELAKEEFFT
jgi:hypothetical protein